MVVRPRVRGSPSTYDGQFAIGTQVVTGTLCGRQVRIVVRRGATIEIFARRRRQLWSNAFSLCLVSYPLSCTRRFGSRGQALAQNGSIGLPDAANNTAELLRGSVVWLPLDEGHGTNVADISGNGHGGTLFGTPLPIWTKGVISNALAFDGVGNYVSVPDAPDLTPSNTLTLSAWVKASPTTTGIIVEKWMSDGQSGSYSLALTNGQIGVEISLDGVYYPLVATTGIEDTDWHHVAGTYDGVRIIVYLDGVVDASSLATGTLDVAKVPFLVGELTGSIDEVRLYDRALSKDEVFALYDIGRANREDRYDRNQEAEGSILQVLTASFHRYQMQ